MVKSWFSTKSPTPKRAKRERCLAPLLALIAISASLKAQCTGPATPDTGTGRQLLSATLAQWGGAAAWAGVTSAEIRGAVTPPNSATSKQLDWFDELTSSQRLSRRTFTDSHGAVKTNTRSVKDGRSISFNSKTYYEPPQDFADVMLSHLPGIALAHILTGKQYRLMVQSSPNAPQTCVVVLSQSPYFRESWNFSTSDETLISVSYKPYNIIEPRVQIWDTIRYLTTTSVNGLVVPTEVTVDGNGTNVVKYTFTATQFNQPDSQNSSGSTGGGR